MLGQKRPVALEEMKALPWLWLVLWPLDLYLVGIILQARCCLANHILPGTHWDDLLALVFFEKQAGFAMSIVYCFADVFFCFVYSVYLRRSAAFALLLLGWNSFIVKRIRRWTLRSRHWGMKNYSRLLWLLLCIFLSQASRCDTTFIFGL